MLGHLIRKEILDHILSLRFIILSAIGALIVWLSLFSGYTYYQARLRDYRSAQAATEEGIRQFTAADKLNSYDRWLERNVVAYLLHKPSTPMCIFVRGLDPSLGRSIPVWGGGRLMLSPAATEPILGAFPPLDLGLVVQVVLSLFVLLLTYDAVCGEKEGGTLRLVASFPVSRDQLLLGKLFGALIPTLTAFGLPLMLGIGVVLVMPDVQFAGPELMHLGMILAAFGLYLAAFICVGLFASSMTHRAATSFVVLLAFWAGTVVALPRLSLIAADGLRPAPSVYEYQVEKARIDREQLEKHRELRAQWQQAHSKPGEEWWKTPEGQEAYWLYYSQARIVVEKWFEPQTARLDEGFRNRYNARLKLALILARLSPAFALKNAVVRLAGTGLDRHRRFETACDQHKERDAAWYRKARDLYFLQDANPAKYGTQKWDVADMPRFTYREMWPGEDVQSALIDVGMLALWGLAFFVGAYVAMLRYDLR